MTGIKTIIYNDANLKEEEVDEVVERVKLLIINSNDEIILGHSNNTYQFPGGHLEGNESKEMGLIREIKEETGIDIKNDDFSFFAQINIYSKNYRNSNNNRKNIIYYYYLNTDKEPNIEETNLDEFEKKNNYKTVKLPLSMVESILVNSIKENAINECIVKEMLSVLKIYKNINKLF